MPSTDSAYPQKGGRHAPESIANMDQISQLARFFSDHSGYAARINNSEAHVGTLQFVAQRFGEAAHGKLTGRIRRHFRWCNQPEQAGQVNKASVVAGFEQWQESARHIDPAVEIDRKQPIEICRANLLISPFTPTPALLTRISTPGCASSTWFGKAATATQSATSHG
jgi:hypothetical protein